MRLFLASSPFASLTLFLLLFRPTLAILGSSSFVRTFSTQYDDFTPRSIELSNGDILLVTRTLFTPGDSLTQDIMVWSLDSKGQINWTKRLGSSDINYVQAVVENSNGSIGILGHGSSSTDQGVLLIILDKDGTELYFSLLH